MEKNSSSKKQSSSSSSSSSIADLFGPKDSSYSKHSSSSSSTVFGSVFGPSSMGERRRDSTSQTGNFKHTAPHGNWSQNNKEESGNKSYYEQGTIDQPCNFSSSIYYGGREVYSPTTPSTDSRYAFKKDEKEDDPDSASRGNWWKGSLYY